MTTKFNQVMVEKDTRILKKSLIKINEIDARQEVWSWEGIRGCSVIFVSEEVQAFEHETLWQMVAETLKIDVTQSNTIKRQDDYTFVNYGFEVY
jgi:hypothetical protein